MAAPNDLEGTGDLEGVCGREVTIRIKLTPTDRFERVENPFAPAFHAMRWDAEVSTDQREVPKIEHGEGVVVRMGRTVLFMVTVDRPLPDDASGTFDFGDFLLREKQ